VARAKKGRAVPTQCADWIFASGRAAAFYLAQPVNSRSRLPPLLRFPDILMFALCHFAHRAFDETMRSMNPQMNARWSFFLDRRLEYGVFREPDPKSRNGW
jgi:hypothetical protein